MTGPSGPPASLSARATRAVAERRRLRRQTGVNPAPRRSGTREDHGDGKLLCLTGESCFALLNRLDSQWIREDSRDLQSPLSFLELFQLYSIRVFLRNFFLSNFLNTLQHKAGRRRRAQLHQRLRRLSLGRMERMDNMHSHLRRPVADFGCNFVQGTLCLFLPLSSVY